MTDAGIHTIENNDEQMVVVHAGVTTFAGSERGATIWAFSLNGTLDPVGEENTSLRPALFSGLDNLVANLDNDSVIYDQARTACHGETGQGGHGGGPSLTGVDLSESEVMLAASDGCNIMPAVEVFTEQQFCAEKMNQ